MQNALKAYLQTEGKIDYRDCEIAYYTYTLFDIPNKYRINVNVHIQSAKSDYIKTLALDDAYEKESEAINYGVAKGKEFIDKSYEAGKVSVIRPDADKNKAKNDKK